MRRAFALALALAVIAGLGVYIAAGTVETFGWNGLKAHLLALGTGAFVILYVIGGTVSLLVGIPWEGRKRK